MVNELAAVSRVWYIILINLIFRLGRIQNQNNFSTDELSNCRKKKLILFKKWIY